MDGEPGIDDSELFRQLLDRTSDGVLVVDPDTGAFLDVNQTACDRLGYDCAELLELAVPDVEVDLPDADAWREHVAEVRDRGSVTFDGRHRRADGSTFPVEVTVSLVDPGGDVDLDREYVVAIARDVTERRERERELESHRAVTDAISDAIVTIDAESTIRQANPAVADVLGYEPEELVGEPLTVLMTEELAAEHLAAVTRYLETGERALDWDYVELSALRKDGSEVLLAVSFSEVVVDGEHLFTGVMRDVSERKAYERELQASNERLEQFAYAASHDLQEPLRTISSYLQLLERRFGDDLDAEAVEFLDYAVDGADRMREMIEGLLEYSRVETQGEPLEPVELEAVVEEVLEDLQVRIEETDAEIEVGELPVVQGDAEQLRRVFQNLLDNAIEYSGDEPPRVEVSAARHDGAFWRVSVADEGIGIAPEHVDDVFEVFERLHAPEDHAGTGIGLALVERIVERHGGEVWTDSVPDEGSTFHLTLPAAEDTA